MQIRIASKQIEKRIIDVAKELKRNPFKVLPECKGKCKSCYFEKMKKDIEKLKDENYLKKVASKKGFLAGLASTILLVDKKIPYVTYVKMNGKTYYYAKRGKVEEKFLVAFQNWDKPNVRMLAYVDLAKKKKLNLFSLPDKIICSQDVPEEFLDYISKKFRCQANEYIVIRWRGKEIKCCGKENSLIKMKQYFYYPAFEKEVEIDVKITPYECKSKCDECAIEKAMEKKLDNIHYLNGEMTDISFIENYKKKILWNIEMQKVLILGNKCYGNDIESFVNEINPKEWEKEVILNLLKKEKRAVILEQPSSAKLLEKYGISTDDLKKEYEERRKSKILEKLPSIKEGKIAKFADELAKAYKIYGKDAVLKTIKEKKIMDVKEKSISYAFLSALDIKGEEWKYSKMEMDFGKHLAKYVKILLEAEGEEYKKAMDNLLKEVG